MSKILVTTLPHEGHLNPTLSIASELRKRGNTLAYLGHPLINQRIQQQGFSTLESRKMGLKDTGYLITLLLLGRSQGKREMKLAIKLFTSRLEAQTDHIITLIENYQPSIILNDVFHYAGAIASEIKGLPWVDCWTAGMLHPDSMPYLSPIPKRDLYELLDYFDKRINTVRKKLGLPPKPSGSFLKASAWLQIYTSCAEIEPQLPSLGENAVNIGPCISNRQEKPIDINTLFSKKYRNYPLVYVSFGTFFNRDKRSIQKLIAAAKNQPFRMLISTPLATSKHQFLANCKSNYSDSGNVVLLLRVPQLQVLKSTQLFITHGGNNSTQEALSIGVPMLVTPIAGEQQYNANRVRWLGVGDIIDVKRDSAHSIRASINRVLNKASFTKKSHKIQQQLKKYNAPTTAANLIEELALPK